MPKALITGSDVYLVAQRVYLRIFHLKVLEFNLEY